MPSVTLYARRCSAAAAVRSGDAMRKDDAVLLPRAMMSNAAVDGHAAGVSARLIFCRAEFLSGTSHTDRLREGVPRSRAAEHAATDVAAAAENGY